MAEIKKDDIKIKADVKKAGAPGSILAVEPADNSAAICFVIAASTCGHVYLPCAHSTQHNNYFETYFTVDCKYNGGIALLDEQILVGLCL